MSKIIIFVIGYLLICSCHKESKKQYPTTAINITQNEVYQFYNAILASSDTSLTNLSGAKFLADTCLSWEISTLDLGIMELFKQLKKENETFDSLDYIVMENQIRNPQFLKFDSAKITSTKVVSLKPLYDLTIIYRDSLMKIADESKRRRKGFEESTAKHDSLAESVFESKRISNFDKKVRNLDKYTNKERERFFRSIDGAYLELSMPVFNRNKTAAAFCWQVRGEYDMYEERWIVKKFGNTWKKTKVIGRSYS